MRIGQKRLFYKGQFIASHFNFLTLRIHFQILQHYIYLDQLDRYFSKIQAFFCITLSSSLFIKYIQILTQKFKLLTYFTNHNFFRTLIGTKYLTHDLPDVLSFILGHKEDEENECSFYLIVPAKFYLRSMAYPHLLSGSVNRNSRGFQNPLIFKKLT